MTGQTTIAEASVTLVHEINHDKKDRYTFTISDVNLQKIERKKFRRGDHPKSSLTISKTESISKHESPYSAFAFYYWDLPDEVRELLNERVEFNEPKNPE